VVDASVVSSATETGRPCFVEDRAARRALPRLLAGDSSERENPASARKRVVERLFRIYLLPPQ